MLFGFLLNATTSPVNGVYSSRKSEAIIYYSHGLGLSL
ncbi:hypothetical protein PLIP_b0018 [Pseudoalteromonas lipolytica LMEB 39]|nr:hypothetical protein [Pseudoalteromonas lipolytica LMEB 39]